MTLRDDVWNHVLVQLRKTGQFKISDLPFNEGQRHTVRRVLREMETLRWLTRDNNRAAIWKLGEVGKQNLNIHPDKHPE